MKSISLIQSSVLAASFVAAAAFAACQGTIGAGTGNGTGGTSPTGTTPTTGHVLPGGLPPGPDTPLSPESSGVLLMRRLTATEYDNIMSHLLGDATKPGLLFPSDPTTLAGYVAPTSVAALNVQLYYQTAQTLVPTAIANPTAPGNQLVVPDGGTTAASQTAAATAFINSFGLAAYRRPVEAAELSDLLSIVFQPAIALGSSFSDSIGYVVQAMIQSPNFLYHWEIGPTEPTVLPSGLVPLTPWQLASRLSMTLWADMPDSTLLQAAQDNELSTSAQVAAQATRMYADARASQALYDLNLQWLLQVAGNVTILNETVHSSPLWTPAVAQSLSGEFTQFLSSVYSPSGDGTLKTLLTAPYVFVNSATAPIYGVTASGSGFTKVELNPAQRAGILTQSAFLSSESDVTMDNPVLRGLSVYVNLLCGAVNPPPAVVPGLPTTVMPGETTRQLFAAHAAATCAQGCHTIFDPPGFAFENYDAIGVFRTTDNGTPVDATGTMITPGGCAAGEPCGTTISFKNAVDLMNQLGVNSEAQWCTERQWYRYAAGRLETSAELGSLQRAYRKGADTAGFSVRDALTSIVGSEAFLYRTPSAGETL